jgi:hypothetical protein
VKYDECIGGGDRHLGLNNRWAITLKLSNNWMTSAIINAMSEVFVLISQN